MDFPLDYLTCKITRSFPVCVFPRLLNFKMSYSTKDSKRIDSKL